MPPTKDVAASPEEGPAADPEMPSSLPSKGRVRRAPRRVRTKPAATVSDDSKAFRKAAALQPEEADVKAAPALSSEHLHAQPEGQEAQNAQPSSQESLDLNELPVYLRL